MMTRVKLGMAMAVGMALSLGGQASAQLWSLNSIEDAVQALSDVLDFTVGSTGDQSLGGNEEVDCPGGVEGGTEDIFDFGLDGVPDYAQMALLDELYRINHPNVRASVNAMRLGLATEIIVIPTDPNPFAGTDIESFVPLINSLQLTLPQLLETAYSLDVFDFPEGVGETEAERQILYQKAIDALCLFASVDNPANLEKTICLDDLIGNVVGILTDLYNPADANLNGILDGSVVLADNDTILDKWLQASGGKTAATDNPAFLAEVDTFVGLVIGAGVPGAPVPGGAADSPFPPAPSGTPVAAPFGLALLAAGLGLAALRRSRRA